MNNYFRVLGVKSNASENDIKSLSSAVETSTILTSCTGERKKRKSRPRAAPGKSRL